jgi:thiol-disulfide isomerase/thioredoxin
MIFKKRQKAIQANNLAHIDDLIATGKPVLIDFFQFGCAPCKVMDGIVDEIADEFGTSAHVVKANVAKVPDAAYRYKIRSTPTFVLVSTTARQKKKQNKPNSNKPVPTQRWRASGLIKKDQLRRVLEREGAQPHPG